MPQSKSIIFIAFLFIFSTFASSQTPTEKHLEIRKFVEQKDFANAINQLKSLQKSDKKLFADNNYDYLLARLYEKIGDFANASANYQAVIKRDSILKEYALWHLSQIMRSSGNLLMERVYLQELSLSSDKSLLNKAVKKRLAKSYFESGNFAETVKLVSSQSSFVSSQKDGNQTVTEKVADAIPVIFDKNIPREDLVLLGNAYLQSKQTEKAREVFNELVNNPPNKNQPDDFALAGVKGLDLLENGEANFGKSVIKLNDEEHFKRAEIYQFNRNFPLARLHYESIVKNFPMSQKVPVSIFQIGRGFGQERNEQKASEWFEKLAKEFPEDDLAKDAIYQSAGALSNLGKTSEAVSRYEKFINENDDADNLERAFLNIVDAYRDAGDNKTALVWTAKTQEKFKGEAGEALGFFAQVKIHIANENWQNALNDLNNLNQLSNFGGNIAGGTNKTEVEFLRGYVLEKLGRIDEATDAYSSIPDGLKNYYGWRATERLKALKSNRINQRINRPKPSDVELPSGKLVEFGRKNILQTPNKTKTHQTIADELLFLGLYDEATPELETALRENLSKNTNSLSDFPPDVAYTLAVFYKRGDMANRTISYIEPLWKKIPNDYPFEMIPREQLELLYPKPFADSLVKYGKQYKVDPRFLLSIMRQESRFQAEVKSNAAARGLMQFISTTANQMALEMKIEDFKQDDLYNPPTAIRFGSFYISKIFKDFPNQPPAVSASYNGGEDRMMRWLKRAKTNDADRYVAEVVFVQTKDYVYKVMANYRVYQMLYDENLKNK